MTSYNVHDIIRELKEYAKDNQEAMTKIQQVSETMYLEEELAS